MDALTFQRLRRWDYPHLPKIGRNFQHDAKIPFEQKWQIRDYMKCIKWIDQNYSALLREDERTWMDLDPQEENHNKIWQINLKIFLEILLINVDEGVENLEDFVIDHFAEIVQRLIEESYANPEIRQNLKLVSEERGEKLIDPSVMSFACELAGLPPQSVLTVREISAILRSRFLKPARFGEVSDPEDLSRKLCQKRLNEIQTLINGALAQMQEITANINTDYRQARTTGG